MRKLLSIMALFVMSLLTISMVSADYVAGTLEIVDVEVNGDNVDLLTNSDLEGHTIDDFSGMSVEEGETLEIEVGLEATGNIEDVEVEVEISGYEYSDYEDLDDSTHVFDMSGTASGSTKKSVDLEVTLPKKLEKDRYFLRITTNDKDNANIVKYVVLQIEPARHGVDIADIELSPGNTQKAGKTFLATVLVENFGDKTEKDVKVTVEIPALGVKATEYIDVVATDNHNVDYEDVPEMFLPLPPTAVAGEYDLIVTVKYDDLRETVTKTMKVNILANEMFSTEDTLVLAVGPESQTVAQGQTATYALALTNAGHTSKAYVLDVVTGDWATATVSDVLIVLEPGKNKVVYVDVTVANNAAEGSHVTSVALKSGDEVLETVSLTANVVAGSTDDGFSLRNGLEIALIVLVVLLVIIGLIIGFSRLRKDDEEEEEQTYY